MKSGSIARYSSALTNGSDGCSRDNNDEEVYRLGRLARLFMRVVTYNIHRCRGLDRRVRPARIVEVLREIDADIIALQEVLSIRGAAREKDQARFIAEGVQMVYAVGGTRIHHGGIYGNVVLSRLPLLESKNYDISVRGREQRGCMRADISANGGGLIHVFNVHLGTAFLERRHQARKLVNEAILNNEELSGARIMLGDFNEWTRGLTTRLLATHLTSADVRAHLPRSKTYPGVLPFLHLDHIYFDQCLELERLTLHKSRSALVASDHLPLVADFTMRPRSGSAKLSAYQHPRTRDDCMTDSD